MAEILLSRKNYVFRVFRIFHLNMGFRQNSFTRIMENCKENNFPRFPLRYFIRVLTLVYNIFFSVFWIFYLNYGDLVKFLQNEDFCIFTFERRFDEFFPRCSAVKSGRDTAFPKKISFSSFLHFSPKIWGFGKIPLQGSCQIARRIISQVFRFLTSLGCSH